MEELTGYTCDQWVGYLGFTSAPTCPEVSSVPWDNDNPATILYPSPLDCEKAVAWCALASAPAPAACASASLISRLLRAHRGVRGVTIADIPPGHGPAHAPPHAPPGLPAACPSLDHQTQRD